MARYELTPAEFAAFSNALPEYEIFEDLSLRRDKRGAYTMEYVRPSEIESEVPSEGSVAEIKVYFGKDGKAISYVVSTKDEVISGAAGKAEGAKEGIEPPRIYVTKERLAEARSKARMDLLESPYADGKEMQLPRAKPKKGEAERPGQMALLDSPYRIANPYESEEQKRKREEREFSEMKPQKKARFPGLAESPYGAAVPRKRAPEIEKNPYVFEQLSMGELEGMRAGMLRGEKGTKAKARN